MTLGLEELNRVIAAAPGVQWVADHTSISQRARAAPDENINLFGLSVSVDEMLEAKKRADDAQRNFQTAPFPRKIDWRDQGGGNFLSDIRDQQQCGACVAFATVATLEARVKIGRQDAGLDLALSEAHLFFCGAGRACGRGWNYEPALVHCRDHGVGLAEDVPYRPFDQDCTPARPVVRVRGWDIKSAEQARLQAIASGGPVIAGMRVFEDFYYYKGGVYRHVAGDFQGLHAVCVIGYDDDRQCWLVRNSWGTGWGESGYVAIGYGECGIDSEFVFFAPDVEYQPGGFG